MLIRQVIIIGHNWSRFIIQVIIMEIFMREVIIRHKHSGAFLRHSQVSEYIIRFYINKTSDYNG